MADFDEIVTHNRRVLCLADQTDATIGAGCPCVSPNAISRLKVSEIRRPSASPQNDGGVAFGGGIDHLPDIPIHVVGAVGAFGSSEATHVRGIVLLTVQTELLGG